MKVYGGSRRIEPPILNIDTKWKLVFAFTPHQLYPRERNLATHWVGATEGPPPGLVFLSRNFSRSLKHEIF